MLKSHPVVFEVVKYKLKDADFVSVNSPVVLIYSVVKFLAAVIGRQRHLQLLFLSSLFRKNDASTL